MALTIATLGDGAMATVCSQIVSEKATEVRMWGRDPARLADMNHRRENPRYLPGIRFADNLRCEPDPRQLFADAQLIICAIPTQYIRATLSRLKAEIPPSIPVVSIAKGIEIATLKRPSEIISELLGPPPPSPLSRAITSLSGPSIAGELARKLPATMVVAGEGRPGEDLAKWIQELFTTSYLRVYWNADLLGVELAGALKNVIAIAAGILDGMRAGNNAKAALLTRGLVEISRLGTELGAQPETFAGLAGMGDLFTTCVSPEGRNRSFGERIGRGEKPADVLASMVGVVEGMPTCKSVVQLAREKGIDMPICEGLHAVLFEGRDPKSQLANLMSREPKRES